MSRVSSVARPLTAAVSTFALAAAVAAGAWSLAPAYGQDKIQVERLANGAPISFADLIEQVSPAVVSVNARTRGPDISFDEGDLPFQFRQMPEEWQELFRDFQRENPAPREGRSVGSGFFISADGYIVTNNHVVEGATEVTVSLKNGEELDAEIIGTDAGTDLAVLKVDPDMEFSYVLFSPDANWRVGDWVVAVGNPFGLGGTATAGIISATGREIGGTYNDFIQFDAQINRGNSGGPTFDLSGNVIGVNSQILSPTGGNVGIGFAIPANVADRITKQLIQHGRVVRGYLGVVIQSVSNDIAESIGLDETYGAMVTEVTSGSPAEKAGFKIEDVILEVDGVKVENNLDLTRRVGDLVVGQKVRFKVLRDDRERTIRVDIGERPENLGASSRDVPDPAKPDEFHGMSFKPLTEGDRERLDLPSDALGLVVDGLAPQSELARKGLRVGDAILEAGSDPIGSIEDLERRVEKARTDGKANLLLLVQSENGRRFLAMPVEEKS